MGERQMFNPDEINPVTGEQNKELVPESKLYDIDKVKERVRIKTEEGEEERFYGDTSGYTIEERLTMGPEPFVHEFAELYRQHLSHQEAVRAENEERKALVEKGEILPSRRKVPEKDTFAYDSKSLKYDIFPFYRSASPDLAKRLDSALEAEGIKIENI